jgi:hypothetical protein
MNPEGLSWRLHPNSDLVLQMHLQPSGKPEALQPSIAFYFTDKAPTKSAQKIVLTSYDIDIAPGEHSYVVTNSFKLPVDVDILSVLPHAHYLGKELQGYVLLPDGRTNWLLRIPEWNFSWQGDYGLKTPVYAPRGSKLVMRFTYDNSTNNPHNPDSSINVTWGEATTEEMMIGFMDYIYEKRKNFQRTFALPENMEGVNFFDSGFGGGDDQQRRGDAQRSGGGE